MRQLFILLIVASGVFADFRFTDLKVKWGFGTGSGKNHFLDMPHLETDAVAAGWVVAERNANSHLPTLKLYCQTEDPSICFMYDVNGYVAGYQISLAVDRLTNPPIALESLGFTQWTFNSVAYWSTEMFLIDEDITEDVSSGKMLRRNSVWARGFSVSELIEIPLTVAEVEANTAFTVQGCIPTMGNHHYYNMTKSTDCNQMLPWFTLYDDDVVIGLGFTVFGTFATPTNGVVEKFERSSSLAVKAIVPDGPDCIYEWAEKPGRTTMHVYFVDNPGSAGRNVNCVFDIGLFG